MRDLHWPLSAIDLDMLLRWQDGAGSRSTLSLTPMMDGAIERKGASSQRPKEQSSRFTDPARIDELFVCLPFARDITFLSFLSLSAVMF